MAAPNDKRRTEAQLSGAPIDCSALAWQEGLAPAPGVKHPIRHAHTQPKLPLAEPACRDQGMCYGKQWL